MAELGAAGYTELVASTLERIEADLVDQVLTKHPTLDLFNQHAKSYTGRSLVLNLEVAEDTSTQFTDESGTFSTTKSPDIIGAAEYKWGSPLVSSVRVDWKRLQQNTGKEELVDLLAAHIEAAKKNHAKTIVEQLHVRYKYDGTPANVGTETGPFHSLDAIVADGAYDADPSGDGIVFTDAFTVGGIPTHDGAGNVDASKSWWAASRIEHPLDDATYGTGNIRKAFRDVANELLVNTSNQHEVTHIICGRDIFEELEDSFDGSVRYSSFEKGQTRFASIMFGNIEVRLDPDCPPKRAYFVDLSAWRFGYLNGNFMSVQPSQTLQGTLDFVVPMASLITVGTNERRASAVLLRPTTAGGDA